MPKFNPQTRERLFHQAKDISPSIGDVFQNDSYVLLNDMVFELAQIDEIRQEMNQRLNMYAASVRTLIRENF